MIDWLSGYNSWYISDKNFGFYLNSLFNIVPLKVLILYSSLALLLGFILQVFWEEKTITETI
jgi:hypothetical protein